MSRPADFLRALARYLSAARLYAPDHRARQQAAEEAYEAAGALLEDTPRSSFSFLSDRVVHRRAHLREMDGWPWARRLADAGVERLELAQGLRREETESFLREVARRLEHQEREDGGAVGDPGAATGAVDAEEAGADTEEAPGREWRHVRFGPLGLETEGLGEGTAVLDREAEALGWLHDVARRDGRVPAAEATTLVQSLALAMRGAREIVVPFVRLKETDQYTAAHCINVAILSMSLADAMDFPDDEIRAIGAAGLLHDVGKVKVPSEILAKPGRLTDQEWEEIRRHPEHGSRILLDSGEGLDLPAVVAYEHHIRLDGSGYPDLHYNREPTPESRLVAVCDFYDALRTRRRYRKPMMAAEVLNILRRNEGETLDPQFVRPFVSLIQRWDPSTVLTEIRPEEGSEEAPAGEGPQETPAGAGPPDPREAGPA